MSLCEKYNLTVGIPIYLINNLLNTKDFKTMKGVLGVVLQKYLNSRKNFPYKCNLIGVYDVGNKLKNGSYDGALGLIDKKKIDMFFRAEVPFTDNQNVFLSHPIYTEEFLLSQSIFKKKLSDFSIKMQLVNSFNIGFLFYCLLTIIIFFVVVLFFYLCFSNFTSFKSLTFYHIFQQIKKIKFQKINYFNFIFIGFVLYNFLIQQIIINNMKTTKVIVGTSEFITTEEMLFSSPLKAAWIEGESDLTFVQNAPKNTFLNKLYLLKNEKPVKIFKRHFSLDVVSNFKYYFLFMKSYTLHIIINLLFSFQEDDGFINDKPYYSTYNVFYITKGIDPKKIHYIYQNTLYSAQGGLTARILHQLKNVNIVDGPKKFKIYKTVKSYIDDYTRFDSLSFENFHYFLLFFFNLNFTIFSTFVIYLLIMI